MALLEEVCVLLGVDFKVSKAQAKPRQFFSFSPPTPASDLWIRR